MKKLLFAIAGAASFAALAADPSGGANDISLVGFESYTVDATVIGAADDGASGTSLWSATGDDASTVKEYGVGDNAALPRITEPRPFAGETNTKYLNLDTNGSELKRDVQAGGSALNVAASGTYIDTLVQFTPSESAPSADDLNGAKLAIWLGVENDVTNLYVRGACYTQSSAADPSTFSFTTNVSYKLSGTYQQGQWYRLTVKAVQSLIDGMSGYYLPGFIISVDGTELTTDVNAYDSNAYSFLTTEQDMGGTPITLVSATNKKLLDDKVFVPALGVTAMTDTPTLTTVGFKGTGALDDFVVTTQAPEFGPATIDFSLTWPASGVTASYKIDDGEPVELTGAGRQQIQVPEGSAVQLILQNADGATKTYNVAEASSEANAIDASAATFTWADYLGDAVAGAYTIDDFADLDMLRKGVAAGLATANETFKQTADIDMTSAGAFAGIGTYAKIPTSGTPFLGTYDGQNYMIANVQRAGTDTQGIFNQVGPSGVIENLVVSNMYWDSELSGEYGLAIVGNAGGGATLRNLTAAGTFGSATKPSTHNIAGIAVRLSPGAAAGEATTIDSCTNNATIYGGYTKLGGINAIVQNQTGFVNGKVVFVNCANNGTLVCKRTATDVTGNGGIVGYFSGTNVELTDCYGNGVITNEDGANTDKDGALVGWTYGGTILDNGGNSAPADKKMIGTWGSATETGFLYATVADGVATTISGSIAVGGSYLLEGAAAPTIELAAGDTIAFDTALGYALTDTGITKAAGLKEVATSTSGTTTTYTGVAYATPTVTVNGGANATATWTVNGEPARAPATLTEGDTYEVFYTANEGFEFAENAVTNASGTAGTENIVINIDNATAQGGAEDWVQDATKIPAETSAATQYPSLDGTALATADAKELTEWAQTNNVVFADVVSAAGGSAEAANAIVDAFLLNCAPAEVATEKEEFKATITVGADGTISVATPDGKDYNGTLQLKGKVNLSDAEWTPVSEASSTYHFYMYELSL